MATVTPTKKQTYNSDWYANFRSTSTEALESTLDYRVRRFMRSLIAKTGISRS